MDRANLAVAGTNIQKDFDLSPTQLGLLFSMFTPGLCCEPDPCWLCAGSHWITRSLRGSHYSVERFYLYDGVLVASLICNRDGIFCHVTGLPRINRCRRSTLLSLEHQKSSPPGSPDHERARATAIYSSAQYIGLALLTPALSFIVANYGWEMSFYLSGGAGILFGIYWLIYYRDPQHSKSVNQAELDYIKAGGGYGSVNQSTVNEKNQLARHSLLSQQKNRLGTFYYPVCLLFHALFFPDMVYCLSGKGLHLSVSQSRHWRHAPPILWRCSVFYAAAPLAICC